MHRISAAAPVLLLTMLLGCQSAPTASSRRLIAHAAMLDFSGLQPAAPLGDVKMRAALPLSWDERPASTGPLYVHRQWRSPSQTNAVGVVYLHLPFPVSARLLIWFAKTQYAQRQEGETQGRLIAQWTDALGREWVDAENARYHVRGYALTSGFDAWFVYAGYRIQSPMNPMEIGMAARSVEAMLPLPLAPAVSAR
jgi:hypothetical protein